ncbi:MAG TPA: nucleoside monophosphate kinase [bacterium]|nr:nucleoside monophosphate kinase [bacterium]
MSTEIKPAVLLLGPTGSGKSPLGDLLAKMITWAHFDFGARLRAIAADPHSGTVTKEEREYILGLLSRHALFPDNRFPIVAKILRTFVDENSSAPGFILNGMPRHKGQARAIEEILGILLVVSLDCKAKVSAERIRRRLDGLGADHAGRKDDTADALVVKLRLFTERTEPLINHYRSRGARIVTLRVEENTSEETLARTLLPEFFTGLTGPSKSSLVSSCGNSAKARASKRPRGP